jgi:hypothetical protein
MTQQDESHLRLLAIFHYVVAGASALFSSIFLMHVFMGIAMLLGTFGNDGDNEPPPALGLLFMLFGAVAVLVGWSFAGALVVAGRSLSHRKRHMFCLVVAGLACLLCNPFGTVLGVFTIIVLSRPAVKEAFGVQSA